MVKKQVKPKKAEEPAPVLSTVTQVPPETIKIQEEPKKSRFLNWKLILAIIVLSSIFAYQ